MNQFSQSVTSLLSLYQIRNKKIGGEETRAETHMCVQLPTPPIPTEWLWFHPHLNLSITHPTFGSPSGLKLMLKMMYQMHDPDIFIVELVGQSCDFCSDKFYMNPSTTFKFSTKCRQRVVSLG